MNARNNKFIIEYVSHRNFKVSSAIIHLTLKMNTIMELFHDLN